MSVKQFTIHEPTAWYQAGDRQIFLADVIDASNSDTMSVGFARYDKGEFNEWIVTYDEVLIVTKGIFTVRSADVAVTAKAGEVIFLTKGTQVVYQGEEDNTEVIYVSYPHWFDAQRNSIVYSVQLQVQKRRNS
jgi:ethanolamine utilization protein EutQ